MARLWDRFFLGVDWGGLDWRSLDHQVLAERLAQVSGLGLRGLGLPLAWPDFQPEPRRLSDRHLRDLEAALNTAAASRVGVIPAIFAPGPDEPALPAWAFSDRAVALEGQLHLLEVLVSYFRGHRAVLAWELDYASATQLGADEHWREVLLPAARQADPGHALALGLSGDTLLQGARPVLEGVAPQADLVLLAWPHRPRLAPLASALAWTLTGRRVLARLVPDPASGEDLRSIPRELRDIGCLGALLPASEVQGLAGAGQAAEGVASGGWEVEAEAAGVSIGRDGFYQDPQASWRALVRQWEGR